MKQLSTFFSLLKGAVACLLTVLMMVLCISSASASALDDDLGPNRDAFLQAALCAGFAMSVDDREVAYAVISLMKVFAPDSVRAMGRVDRALWIGEWAKEGERMFKKMLKAGDLTVDGDEMEFIRACHYMAEEYYKNAPTE